MNYIEQIRKFWQCNNERPIGCNATALYFYLLNINNSLGWKDTFRHSDRYIAIQLGISVNTVRTAKNLLAQLGLISFKAPQKKSKSLDGCTLYSLSTVLNNDTVHDTDVDTDADTDVNTDVDTDADTRDKLNKTKLNKNNNIPLSPNGDIPQGELEFPLDENFESPVKPPGEKEKSSAKKEKESDRELVNKIVNYYHEKCPGLATVKTITDKRVSTVMARVRQHGKEKVAEMIERAGESNFLAGDNQRGWIADFDWIFKPTNFVKVYEGKYDNRNRTSKELPASGREGVIRNGYNPTRNDAENKRAERDALGEIARQVLHRSMPKKF